LILNALICLIFLLIIVLAARRSKGFSSPAFWLMGYAGLAFAICLFQLGSDTGFFAGQTLEGRLRLEEYVSLGLALLLYQCLRLFLGRDFQPAVFFVALAISATLIAINNTLFIFLAGLGLTLLTLVLLGQALAQTRQHLHRNRLFYWLPVLALAIGNELSVYYRQGQYANDLRLGATLLLAYIVLRHHIPDVRDFIRQFSIYLITTLVSMALYIGGFALAERLFRVFPAYDPLFAGAGLAVIISLLFTPLFGFVRKVVNSMFRLPTYDSALTLREYSASISNVLELDKLAAMAVGLVVQVLEIEKGYLFLVDPEIGEDDHKVFRLSSAGGVGALPGPSGSLDSVSPVAGFFNEKRGPLLQYDIDFAPNFLDAPLSERKWLSSLVMDVYVPIFARDEWIGLLALGPKPKNRYTDEDLNMLATVASQTGVGLENARLVENLKHLNEQVREAYVSLDRANHDLAKLELTKSNFISIASHELRTPLTVARGYAEMMLENESLPEEMRELVKGIHKSILRQHEIMDSMFDIAKMDSRAAVLEPQDVFINEVIANVAQELSQAAGERSQEIVLDLPQLPSIKADPVSLSKLFQHLLTNAIKFTPNNGHITVTGAQLPPNGRDLPEGGVEIVVSDTGVGVAKDYQEIIFTKFYQPGELLNRHSTGKTKFKGSGVGLGLALSRGIVEEHGGRIWVESPGYDEENYPGSDFHVVLPLRLQGESETVRIGSAVKLKI
jgi:signal transduction histidine kinase